MGKISNNTGKSDSKNSKSRPPKRYMVAILCTVITLVTLLVVSFVLSLPEASGQFDKWQQAASASAREVTTFRVERDDTMVVTSSDYVIVNYRRVFPIRPNTRYRLSADVWSNAVPQNRLQGNPSRENAVALISAAGVSRSYNTGKGGWQRLHIYIDNVDDEELVMLLQHGMPTNHARGRTRFRNILLEEMRHTGQDNNWRFLGLIFRNIDVNVMVDGQPTRIRHSMTNEDVEIARRLYRGFPATLYDLSNGQMRARMDVRVINEPLRTLTRHDTYLFMPDVSDVFSHYQSRQISRQYDHVMSFVRFRDPDQDPARPSVPTFSWNGLGGMLSHGVTHSIMQMPYVHQANAGFNREFMPDMLLVHEFLHGMERTAYHTGVVVPRLHHAYRFGAGIGYNSFTNNQQRADWYRAFLSGTINHSGGVVNRWTPAGPQVATETPAGNIGLTDAAFMRDRYRVNTVVFHQPIQGVHVAFFVTAPFIVLIAAGVIFVVLRARHRYMKKSQGTANAIAQHAKPKKTTK